MCVVFALDGKERRLYKYQSVYNIDRYPLIWSGIDRYPYPWHEYTKEYQDQDLDLDHPTIFHN